MFGEVGIRIVVTFGILMTGKKHGHFWSVGNILLFVLGGSYSSVFTL